MEVCVTPEFDEGYIRIALRIRHCSTLERMALLGQSTSIAHCPLLARMQDTEHFVLCAFLRCRCEIGADNHGMREDQSTCANWLIGDCTGLTLSMDISQEVIGSLCIWSDLLRYSPQWLIQCLVGMALM
jgi:hypothetical protein